MLCGYRLLLCGYFGFRGDFGLGGSPGLGGNPGLVTLCSEGDLEVSVYKGPKLLGRDLALLAVSQLKDIIVYVYSEIMLVGLDALKFGEEELVSGFQVALVCQIIVDEGLGLLHFLDALEITGTNHLEQALAHQHFARPCLLFV